MLWIVGVIFSLASPQCTTQLISHSACRGLECVSLLTALRSQVALSHSSCLSGVIVNQHHAGV